MPNEGFTVGPLKVVILEAILEDFKILIAKNV